MEDYAIFMAHGIPYALGGYLGYRLIGSTGGMVIGTIVFGALGRVVMRELCQGRLRR